MTFVLCSSIFAQTIKGIYFGEIGCSHCDLFFYVEKPLIEKKFNVTLDLQTFDILSDGGYALCEQMLADQNLKFNSFPVLFIGKNIYRGNREIEENLEKEILYYLKNGDFRSKLAVGTDSGIQLKVTAIFAAGLLDGINPCAFTTLIFFLSVLSFRQQKKSRLFLTGCAFVLAIFLTYFAIGFGILSGLRGVLSNWNLTLYLNIIISIIALLLAFFNLKDAIAAHNHDKAQLVLKMPKRLQDFSHFVMRRFSSTKAFVFGAFLAGTIVAMLEMACTGQVYFPTLAFALRSNLGFSNFALLFVYNLAFILPLCLVFGIFFATASNKGMVMFYSRHLPLVKILTAILFVAMIAVIWIF